MGRPKTPLKDRLLAKTRPKAGCWEWQGSLGPNGYGQIRPGGSDGRCIPTHRASFTVFKGPIPQGLDVMHICDNRICVNPGHLVLGTRQDNNSDRDRKGRTAYGERSGNCKLKTEEVLSIRRRVGSGESQAALAREFKVSPSHVCCIVNRTRRHRE